MTAVSAYAPPPNNQAEIEQRIRTHMQLVRKIAWQIHGRVRDVFEIDDLVQIGMLALVEAAKRFHDTGQASFTSYAAVRIRGSLTDHLRKNLTLTRLGVQRRTQIATAEIAVKAAGGDPANRDLVAAELGITITELQTWRDKATSAPNKSLEEIYDDHSVWFADKGHTPESAIVSDELRQTLATHLKRLKERRETLSRNLGNHPRPSGA
jgi:RNA polymerase sigma factor for flagellar operon FliA